MGEVEEVKGEINGDGRRTDFGIRNTRYNIQIYYRI